MVALLAAFVACRHSPAERLARTPELELPGQSKCSVGASSSHPLVVEWAAADRASLEARLARGLVAVRAQGCEIEVLRECEVPGQYSYLGLTRKNDRVKIRSADELYAQLPIGAARLEAKLARQGSLDVEIALVGMFEAPAGRPKHDALKGECRDVTHVITGVQVGAFQFLAGGAGEIRAGGGVGQIGAGAASTAERETLSADGEPGRCDGSSTTDPRPPEGCGALIRIELTAIARPAEVAEARPAPCPVGGRWNGTSCVTEACPEGMSRQPNGICAAPGAATSQAATPTTSRAVSEETALCRRSCERDLACKAAASGVAEPEGEGREGLLQMCVRTCEFVINDFNRPQLRRCVALETCEEFDACTGPDEDAGGM